MRTILIGDIHACSGEFERLLERVSPGREDRLILLGDLVNKGPDPGGVVRLVHSLDAMCLRGNHDADHLQGASGGRMKKESEVTREMMTEEDYALYLEMVRAMPLYYENADLVAVHGAVDPALPLRQQPADLLTGGVAIDLSWKDRIDLGRPLVVGHKRYSRDEEEPYVVPGRFYGIDTGCVYGGALTALEWPSGEFRRVRAKRDYTKGKR